MRFEWDDAKAALNLAKHGVSFREAAVVYTLRGDNIRLISVRFASRRERRLYAAVPKEED